MEKNFNFYNIFLSPFWNIFHIKEDSIWVFLRNLYFLWKTYDSKEKEKNHLRRKRRQDVDIQNEWNDFFVGKIWHSLRVNHYTFPFIIAHTKAIPLNHLILIEYHPPKSGFKIFNDFSLEWTIILLSSRKYIFHKNIFIMTIRKM